MQALQPHAYCSCTHSSSLTARLHTLRALPEVRHGRAAWYFGTSKINRGTKSHCLASSTCDVGAGVGAAELGGGVPARVVGAGVAGVAYVGAGVYV